DYAADTRGYTYGLELEYQGPRIEVRFGEMLMPKVANGIDLDWDLTRSHAENFELEGKHSRKPGFFGTGRGLAFINHSNSGNYHQAVLDYMNNPAGGPPDITKHAPGTRVKYGVGLNAFQELYGVARLFARIGWNDGSNESFAYTEVDNTVELGFDLRGKSW